MRRITDAFSRWIRDPLAFAGLALLALLYIWLLTPMMLIWTAVLIELSYTWIYHHENAAPCMRYFLDCSDLMTFHTDNHLNSQLFGLIPAVRRMPWARRRRVKRLAQFWITAVVLGFTLLYALSTFGNKVYIWALTTETLAVCTQRFLLSLGVIPRPGTEPTALANLQHNPRWALYFFLEVIACIRPLAADLTSIRWTSCWAHLLINTSFCVYISRSRPAKMIAEKGITRHMFNLHDKPYYCTVCKDALAGRRHSMISYKPIQDAPHHFWKSSLRLEAERGCRICGVVWQSWLRTPVSVPALLGLWKPVSSYTWSGDGQNFEISSNTAEWFETKHNVVFKVLDMGTNKLQWDSVNRNVGEYTWSPRIIEIAKSWLSSCEHEHEQCLSLVRGKSYVPTRLIRITRHSQGLRLSLHLTTPDEKPLQYATLSHCWGQIGHGKLELNNYSVYLLDIPLRALPLNFRHAVQIAADLSFEFIWIDSLCIIQGCKEDWDREAPMMRDVYINSACNLAATDASDSTQGLIFVRNTVGLIPATCSFDGSVYLTNDSDSFGHPLYHRAWVMQELLLAPRTLHFGRAQVYWSCNKTIASEIYPGGISNSSASHIDHHPALDFAVSHGSGVTTILNTKLMNSQFGTMPSYRNGVQQINMDKFPSSSVGAKSLLASVGSCTMKPSLVSRMKAREHQTIVSDPSHPFNYWALLVESYTEMNITVPADRPVAIFGIVLLLAPHLGQYLGGLWQVFLPMELLWETSITSRRPEGYQAPSWSWLSVEGPILYTRCYKLEHGQAFMLTVLDTFIEYDANNTLVASSPGWLSVRGKLAGAFWDGQAYKHTYRADVQPVIRQLFAADSARDGDESEHYMLKQKDKTAPRIYFDEFQDRYHLNEDLFLLAVRRGYWDSDAVIGRGHWDSDVAKGEAVDGLVLRRHQNGLDYVRVGIFTDAGRQSLLPFFDSLPESDITIL